MADHDLLSALHFVQPLILPSLDKTAEEVFDYKPRYLAALDLLKKGISEQTGWICPLKFRNMDVKNEDGGFFLGEALKNSEARSLEKEHMDVWSRGLGVFTRLDP